MNHHPSPLAKTSVYRLSSGMPNYHYSSDRADLDVSLGHTLEDVIADEKLDTFFGTLLPVFHPSLQSLYQGVSANFSSLDPQSILDDLLPGMSRSPHTVPPTPFRSTDAINLLKLSLAKYAAGTIREAQDSLTAEQRISSAEV